MTGSAENAASAENAGIAEELPVARVLPMVQPAHLDRAFDYHVPSRLSAETRAGVRVRVRFAGRLIDGYVLERVAASEHEGRLGRIDKVVSPLPVLTAELARLCLLIARRYAGSRADVLRLAVPPRHARAEAAALTALGLQADGSRPVAAGGPGAGGAGGCGAPGSAAAQPSSGGPARAVPGGAWAAYTHGPAYLEAARDGRAPRAVWQALPGEDWPLRMAEAAYETLRGGRSSVLIVPDKRDLDRVAAALAGLGASGETIALAAGLGPQARYRRWITALAGPPCIVVGNRSAVFAPVARLGLVGLWDDGDDTLAERRAPYPHARDAGLLRADAAGAGFLLGGHARTAEGQYLVDHGWAQDLTAPRPEVRRCAPLIRALADSEQALARDPSARRARLPAIGFEAARAALSADRPVLVQVPRAGYVPVVGCAKCREPARCRRCAGPLALPGPGDGTDAGPAASAAAPACRWCGTAALSHTCSRCGSRALRARVTGAQRTAEEFGMAFRGVPVIGSSGPDVRTQVEQRACVVVATVGAEPLTDGGYGAALLLDGWSMLTRPDLRAGEEALRRWMAAASLVRPADDGGRVVVVADAGAPVVQALIRWDPVGRAQGELAERREVRFPPSVRMAAVDGAPKPLAAFTDMLDLPESVEVLGPVPVPPGVRAPGGAAETESGSTAAGAGGDAVPGQDDAQRVILRAPRKDGAALSRALSACRASFSAHRVPGTVRVQVDPVRIG